MNASLLEVRAAGNEVIRAKLGTTTEELVS